MKTTKDFVKEYFGNKRIYSNDVYRIAADQAAKNLKLLRELIFLKEKENK